MILAQTPFSKADIRLRPREESVDKVLAKNDEYRIGKHKFTLEKA